ASGECEKNLWSNLDSLRDQDEVKFVLASRGDYEWARETIRHHHLDERVSVLISAAFAELAPAEIVDWMLTDRLNARFQLQAHKYIWPHDARRV
ncbi:MAG TPA: 7-carboxy-7-deazaguanine synthase QueE, partial [Blastocatellia bacterium]|nr:7-carboxy-7-deazaguanine synthase QueE [Blastocatellia bacterium]